MNYLEIFNEVCFYCLIMFFSLFSDFIDVASIKYNTGYLVMSFVIVNMVVNITVVITLTVQMLISIIKRCRRNKKKVQHFDKVEVLDRSEIIQDNSDK